MPKGRDLSSELFAPAEGQDLSVELFTEAKSPEDWKSRVKPIDLGGGRSSVQREDGGVWFGSEQGNKGMSGWFDQSGMRLGDEPGKPLTSNQKFLNARVAERKRYDQRSKTIGGKVLNLFPEEIQAMGGGIAKAAMGAGQLLSRIPFHGREAIVAANGFEDPISQGMDRIAGQLDTAATQTYGHRPFMETLGQMVIPGPKAVKLSGPLASMPRVAPILNKAIPVAQAGATGAVMAPLTQMETGVTSEADYLTRKKNQALMGGTIGGGFGALGEVAGVLGSKMRPEAQAVQGLGEQFNVRTLAPDLAPSPGMNKAAVLSEYVPGSGMVKQRLAQQAEAEKAMADYVKRIGESIDGGDWDRAIQKGITRKIAEKVTKARELYDEVGALSGARQAQRNNTIEAMKNVIDDTSKSSSPDDALISDMSNRIRRLTQNSVEAEKIGERPMDKTWFGMRELRSEFGKAAKKYRLTDPVRATIYDDLREAVGRDLKDFAESSNNPILAAKNKAADRFYAQEVMPYKIHGKEYGDWAKALKGKDIEPEQIYKYFIQAGREGKAKYLYDALDDVGRAAVKARMLNDAYAEATKKAGVFSPALAASSLEKIQKSTGIFFKGQDKMELDGFVKLMRGIQRAGQVAENPPTGQRLLYALMAGEGLSGVGRMVSGQGPETGVVAAASGATALVSARILTKLFSTKMGKNILLRSSAASDDAARAKILEQDIPRFMAIYGAKEDKKEQ